MRRLHYTHSIGDGAVTTHALFRRGGDRAYGAVVWIPPTARAARSVIREGEDWRGVLYGSRLVVDPEVPKNGASFLLSGSMRLIDRQRWPILLTHADLSQNHTGKIYMATGWELDGERAGGETWVRGGVMTSIRGFAHGRNTVEYMRRMGYQSLGRSVKRRFVHRLKRVLRNRPGLYRPEKIQANRGLL